MSKIRAIVAYKAKGPLEALTHGATIEMAEEASEENSFLFGLTRIRSQAAEGGTAPYCHYDNEPETRADLDLIFSDHFTRYEPGVFGPLRMPCCRTATTTCTLPT